MALDVYFPDDIQRVTTGLLVATVESARGAPVNVERITGQIGAYRAMAASFGLVWGSVIADARADVGQDVDWRLGWLMIEG
jgi:hypothetical protein